MMAVVWIQQQGERMREQQRRQIDADGEWLRSHVHSNDNDNDNNSCNDDNLRVTTDLSQLRTIDLP